MSLFVIISLLLTAIDQLTKFFVESNLYNESRPVIENVFHFTYLQNSGAAWGFLSENNWLLLILTPIILIVIIVYLHKNQSTPIELISGAMIVGGAIGNYIDRLFRGYVVDFLDFRVWPIFNLADVFIVIGCGLFLISLFRNGEDKNTI